MQQQLSMEDRVAPLFKKPFQMTCRSNIYEVFCVLFQFIQSSSLQQTSLLSIDAIQLVAIFHEWTLGFGRLCFADAVWC